MCRLALERGGRKACGRGSGGLKGVVFTKAEEAASGRVGGGGVGGEAGPAGAAVGSDGWGLRGTGASATSIKSSTGAGATGRKPWRCGDGGSFGGGGLVGRGAAGATGCDAALRCA